MEFKADIAADSYYAVIKSATFVSLQQDGDATKRFIVNTGTGSVMAGGTVYKRGDPGYFDAVDEMMGHAERASQGSFGDSGWGIPR